MPNLFAWQGLHHQQVAVGAIIGTYSHIVLDSIMHMDITPLAPFSDINPLLRIVSLSTLHWICFGAGIGALLILVIRKLINDEIEESQSVFCL